MERNELKHRIALLIFIVGIMSFSKSNGQVLKSYQSITDSIWSDNLQSYRSYFIYKSGDFRANEKYNLIITTDGQEVMQEYPAIIDSLSNESPKDSFVLIGLFSNETPNGINSTLRQTEYVKNKSDVYMNHKRFFLNEFLPSVIKRYQLNKEVHRTIFYGFSNGGAFGLDIYFNNNKTFDDYIIISPMGFKVGFVPKSKEGNLLNPLYLAYGDEEIFIALDDYKALVELLIQKHVNFKEIVYHGGHKSTIWEKVFVQLYKLLLSKEDKSGV